MNGALYITTLQRFYKAEIIMKRILFLFLVIPFFLYSESPQSTIGIDEHLGTILPLDTKFIDESGNEISLKNVITKPVVLSFVYYKCPGICSPLLTELASTIGRSDLKAGEDFQIITISMDETETYKDAAEKKTAILSLTEREVPLNSWMFLTGTKENIRKISDAAGYMFKRNGKDFLHTGTFIFLSKEGKVCRYLYPDYSRKGGFSILPFDFKMAMLETSEGKVSKTMAKLIQYCFSYDPKGRTYVLNLTRIFGAGIILFVVVFIAFIIRKPKKEMK